jgi:Fe-S-cluster containining protein
LENPFDAMNPPSNESISDCRRCGTCCKKGGPTLHAQDRKLVENGAIPLRYLVTIRRGEIVRDPEGGNLIRADSEMIKLKGSGAGWTCILFDESENRCTEYDRRPTECRAMACWDTTDIRKAMASPRLCRRDLLSGVEGLWDLIEDHEQRCSVLQVALLSEPICGGSEKAGKDLMEMLGYDRALRDLLVGKGTDPDHLEFFLGRPLDRLLDGFGLRLVRDGGKVRPCGRHTACHDSVPKDKPRHQGLS